MSACVSGLLEGLSYISLDAFLRGTTIPAAILRLALAGLVLAGLALGHGVAPWVCFGTVPYVS